MGFLMPRDGVGRVPAQLTDHGAVHDKPDDKLVLFEYESFTRNMVANNAILLCAGRVRSKSEGGTAGGAINCSHSTRKIGGDRFYNLKNSKQGIGPALFFAGRPMSRKSYDLSRPHRVARSSRVTVRVTKAQ